jgi:hypothetical protein
VGDHVCFVLFGLERRIHIGRELVQRNPALRKAARKRRVALIGKATVELWRLQVRGEVKPSQAGPPVCAQKLRRLSPLLVTNLARYPYDEPATDLPIDHASRSSFGKLRARLFSPAVVSVPQVQHILVSPGYAFAPSFRPTVVLGRSVLDAGRATIYNPKQPYVRAAAEARGVDAEAFTGLMAKVDVLGGMLGVLLAKAKICPADPEENGLLKAAMESLGHVLLDSVLEA